MLNKVTDYIILRHNSAEALVELVKQSMAEEWVPSGPLVAFGSELMQVMVRFAAA